MLLRQLVVGSCKEEVKKSKESKQSPPSSPPRYPLWTPTHYQTLCTSHCIYSLDNRTAKPLRHDLFLIFLPSSLHLTPIYPLHQISSIYIPCLASSHHSLLRHSTMSANMSFTLPAISKFPEMNPEVLQAQWLVFLRQQY